jgi:TPR repeat protein
MHSQRSKSQLYFGLSGCTIGLGASASGPAYSLRRTTPMARKALTSAMLLLTVVGSTWAQGQTATAAQVRAAQQSLSLTNGDIVQFVKLGIPASDIVAKIRSSKSLFDTSSTAVAVLRDKGVPNSVIMEMVLASKNSQTNNSRSASATPKVKPPNPRPDITPVPSGTAGPATAQQTKGPSTQRVDVTSVQAQAPAVRMPGPLYAGTSCAEVGGPAAEVRIAGVFVDGFITDKLGNPVAGLDVLIGDNLSSPIVQTDNHGYYFGHLPKGAAQNYVNQLLQVKYGPRILDQRPLNPIEGTEDRIDITYPGLASDLPWQSRSLQMQEQMAALQSKAEAGDADAGLKLADGLMRGMYIPPNSEKAFEMLQTLASKGNVDAMLALSGMYLAGQGVQRDLPRSVSLGREAAELDVTGKATFWFARSSGVVNGLNESICWYEKAAERKFSYQNGAADFFFAAAGLGDLYSTGHTSSLGPLVVPVDYAQAAYWYQKAIADGDRSAVARLQNINMKISPGFAQDVIEQLKIKADSGDRNSQIQLAQRYGSGDGTPKDIPAAVRYMTLAANNTNVGIDPINVNPADILSKHYEGVDGDPPDYKQAYYWAKRAAELIVSAGPEYWARLNRLKALAGVVDDSAGPSAGATIAGNQAGVDRQREAKEQADQEESDRRSKIDELQSEIDTAQRQAQDYDERAAEMQRQQAATVGQPGGAAAAAIAQIGIDKFNRDAQEARQKVVELTRQIRELQHESTAAANTPSSSSSTGDSISSVQGSSSGGSGTYTGPNAVWVHRLLSRVGSWSCPSSPIAQDGTPPQVQTNGTSMRDQYVKAALLEAWTAECYARQERDNEAQAQAQAMMQSLQAARGLCSNAAVIGGSPSLAPDTMGIFGCGELSSSGANSQQQAQQGSMSGSSGSSSTPQLTIGCLRITNVRFDSSAEGSRLLYNIVNNCNAFVRVGIFTYSKSADTCMHGQAVTMAPGDTTNDVSYTPLNQMQSRYAVDQGDSLTQILVPNACSNPWLSIN